MLIELADNLRVEVGLLVVRDSLTGRLVFILRLVAFVGIRVSELSREVGVSDGHLEDDTHLVVDDGRQLTVHIVIETFRVGRDSNYVPKVLLQVRYFGAVASEFLDVRLVFIGPLLVIGRDVFRVRAVLIAARPLRPEAIDARDELVDKEPVAADQGDGLAEVVMLFFDLFHCDRLALLFAISTDLLDEHNENDDEAGKLHEYIVESLEPRQPSHSVTLETTQLGRGQAEESSAVPRDECVGAELLPARLRLGLLGEPLV